MALVQSEHENCCSGFDYALHRTSRARGQGLWVLLGIISLALSQLTYQREAYGQQSITLQEVQNIRDRAMAGNATEADRRRLMGALPPKELKVLIDLQSTAGKRQAPEVLKGMMRTVADVNHQLLDQKIIAILDALQEVEKTPGQDAYNLGARLLSEKQYDSAIEQFTKAINLGYADSYRLRGRAWAGKQDYERAISDFTSAIQREPADPFNYIHRADAYARKGDHVEAIADYRAALPLVPDQETRERISAELAALNGNKPNSARRRPRSGESTHER